MRSRPATASDAADRGAANDHAHQTDDHVVRSHVPDHARTHLVHIHADTGRGHDLSLTAEANARIRGHTPDRILVRDLEVLVVAR